jgi:hypothetical protein
VKHTQLHLVLKKDTNFFHYTSNFEEFLVNSLFHETKIPMMDMKVQVYSSFSKKLEKNKISKLHEEWKISFSQV